MMKDTVQQCMQGPTKRISAFPWWLNTLIFICSVVLMGVLFTIQAHADEAPDLDKITSGTLFVQDEMGSYANSTLLKSNINMSISAMVARVSVEQSFTNTGTNWLEGLYVFPLPETAAVNKLTIRIGERTINGAIAEKVSAKQRYEQARSQGRVASLVNQQRPNLFTTKIANIAPGETIQITLHYVQKLAFQNDKFSLRFPMTLTPRYSNSTVADADAINANPAFPHEQVLPTAQLQATLNAPGAMASLYSPSHELLLEEKNDGSSVEIRFTGVQLMDRDLILSWSPPLQDQPTVSTWIESVDNQDYLLAMLLPPQFVHDTAKPKRELILVIDSSGSMAGESIRSAKRALHSALDGLASNDRFNLFEFNSYAHKAFNNAVLATPENLTIARQAIDQMHAGGGTEMESALKLALANPTTGFLRQVVFVTDGSVGNEDHLFKYIETHLRRSRLFTVGIGSAPNSYFMRKAAQAGRGTYTFVGNINEAEKKMKELFLSLENPALTDIVVKWQGEDGDYAPNPIADLYLGEPLVISARLGQATTGLTVSGQFKDTPWQQTINLDQSSHVNSGLSTLWARQKIESLLDAQRRSENPEQFKPVITRIALEHELLSPYTSLLAIDSILVRPVDSPLSQTKLATAMPAGSAQTVFDLPQGAAGSDTLLLLSLLSAMAALTCLQLNRRESNHAI